MGLFWSMQPGPGEKKGLRLAKRDVTTPYHVLLSVIDNHITAESLTEGTSLANTTLERWYMDKGVKRIPVRHGRIRGTLFVPKGLSLKCTALNV